MTIVPVIHLPQSAVLIARVNLVSRFERGLEKFKPYPQKKTEEIRDDICNCINYYCSLVIIIMYLIYETLVRKTYHS